MRLSLAMCTYNGEKYIKEQLNSILNQTLSLDEVIVCDDNSVDDTFDILENYKKNYPDIFKIYKNEEGLGTMKNFEKAVTLTTGDLIFLSDQDDIWNNNKVEIMTSFFEKNPFCKLLFTDGNLISKDGAKLNVTLWEKWEFHSEERQKWRNNNYAFFELLENKNKITGATVCFDKVLKSKLPIIGYPFFYHDAFLGIHAAAQNGLYFLNEALIRYRVHDKQQVGIANNLSLEQYLKQNSNTVSKAEFIKEVLKFYKRKKISFFIRKIKKFFRK